MKPIILTNVKVIDGTGKEPIPNGFVVIEGDRIKEVGDKPLRKPLSGASLLNCKRQTLLPGLIDAHVHCGAVEANIMEQQRRNYSSLMVIKALKVLRETLDQGFTTIRDAGGADAGFREAQKQGLISAPRMVVAGLGLSQTGGHGDFRLPSEVRPPYEDTIGFAMKICDGVDEVRRAAREQLRRGADYIKVMAGGGAMSPSDEIDTSQYSPEELQAIVYEAKAAGTYVAAHVYSTRSIRNCVTAGVRSLEHGNLMDERAAQAIREAGGFLVPTLVTYEMISRMGRDLGIPENNIRKVNQAREHGMKALAIAYRYGVKIASGSDLLGPMQIYKAMELELKARVLGPMGAIVASTKTNAELLRKERDLGTIEAGKLADLILVNGDPLKDITVLQHYQEKITLIMQGGAIHKNIL